ncbi:hypothetical protein BDV18DRAFT_129517 [Aspergillus unguis]
MNGFPLARGLRALRPVGSIPKPQNATGRFSYLQSRRWASSTNSRSSQGEFYPVDSHRIVEPPSPAPPTTPSTGNAVRLSLAPAKYADFGAMFLRDNCRCPKCVHPDTSQRIVDTFSIPEDIKATGVDDTQQGVIKIQWSDGHLSSYPIHWLSQHSQYYSVLPLESGRRPPYPKLRHFLTQDPSKKEYPTVSYSAVMADDKGVLQWLQHIYDWGFCFVKDTPVNPESTEALLKRIAHIRHTHYGGFWDFTADLSFKDTAYTNEFLGAHTDNTYFTDPARLQLFHLLSHTDGEGGASLLVDGFQAAKTLIEEDQVNALHLKRHKHPFHASGNEDMVITPTDLAPVFGTHPLLGSQLIQIRWNNYDRATKWNWQTYEQAQWYKAAKHFDEIIRRPQSEIWTQLEPGTALIFDNWRMLHGRSAFTGKRRMCGGYINNDDFISRYRVLKFGRRHVMDNIGNTKYHHNNPNSYV